MEMLGALYKRVLLYGYVRGTIKEYCFMEMLEAFFYGNVKGAPLWRY